VPRLALGRALLPLASAAIDLSDGLAQDLGHLARASGAGAEVRLTALPRSAAYRRATAGRADPFAAALAGGEDYELCLAVPPRRVAAALAAAARLGVRLTVIGAVTSGRGVRLVGPGGRLHRAPAGHDHLAPRRRAR
jgi:thiamine-monophosphate kinase